ncbi:MAG: cache domain-containing protein, partial [Christensenellales bacterium]
TGENAAMLRLTLESRFALLDNVAEKIAEDPRNAREMLTNLGKYANGYGFKRLGYMNSTGRTVTSDGETGDFFYRAYFRMGMDGQYCITGEINDRLGNGEAVHIMSAPVRNPKTGKVIGVVFADYTPEMFHRMMDVETFGGEGRGYIVESSGEIVVASSSMRLTGTGNLLDGVADFSETGRQDAEALRQVLAGEQPGDGRVLGAGKLRFCCRKIENGRQDDTWYLVMVMDAGALYGRMYGVFSSICSLLSVTVLMCAAFIFAILMAYRRYNEGLYQAAYTDALTGGSNFSGFLMKVNNAEGGYMVSCDLDDYRMIASMFGAQKGDELLRGVYECIKSGLTEGEPVARVDADHFAFHLVERQRSAVLERLRQIERGIRRLSDKMGVIHPCRGSAFTRCARKRTPAARASWRICAGRARSSADNTVAFYRSGSKRFENMQLEDRFDEAIGEHRLRRIISRSATKTGEIVGGEALVRWCRRTAPCFARSLYPAV